MHRLADQRVAELVPAVGVDDDQLGRDDGPQRGLEVGLAHPGDAGQQLVAEPGAADRGHPQHPLGRLGQQVDPGRAAGHAGCVGMSAQSGSPDIANCSMKNGLPWLRSSMASTVVGPARRRAAG